MVAPRSHRPPSLTLRATRWGIPLLLLGLGLLAAPAQAAPPWSSRDELICRGASAEGYSYYWGGSCWCRSGCTPALGSCWAGSCSGNCPSCTHSGTYGADCSGLVNKVWEVPDPIATTTCGHGPYVANSFRSDHAYWDVISRSSLQRGDVLASSSHVVLFHHGDPWGSMVVYEAKGCAYGVVHNWRTCSSSYSAARRINISDCACTPGDSQSQACGNCGYRTRACGSDCQWDAWSACQGEGPCSPGASQTRDCCDCGTQSRSCDSGCQWGAWSACAGPDPGGGDLSCDTGQAGPCAAGVQRCVDGCLQCVRLHDPAPELCDGADNDCDGVVDNGSPSSLGDPPPPFAARLLDASFPRRLRPGETGAGWALFENVGTEPWPAGEVWLASDTALGGTASPLHDPGAWPAHDVLAIPPHAVGPGETVLLSFSFSASSQLQQEVTERFTLLTPAGDPLACPSPTLSVIVGPSYRPAPEQPVDPGSVNPAGSGSDSDSDPDPNPDSDPGSDTWSNASGCHVTGFPGASHPPTAPGGPAGPAAFILMLGWLLSRRTGRR